MLQQLNSVRTDETSATRNRELQTKKSGNSCTDPIILLSILIYFWLILNILRMKINTKKRPRNEIIKNLSAKYSTFPLPNCPGKLSINLLKRTKFQWLQNCTLSHRLFLFTCKLSFLLFKLSTQDEIPICIRTDQFDSYFLWENCCVL